MNNKYIPPHNKKPLQEFKKLKQGKNKIDLKKILKYVSTSLTLLTLQEVLILRLLKLQN
ncbi:hypothetical protein [Helicobacter sp. T3_23-1059]